ncbi:putative 3-phytase [Microsporum canis]|uniref:Phytase A n=1 Tax=Arthroderma otae (strain ATCC MYA-4605 / CBS 113480) TaxID=554155 RepID=C5FGG6_ARTOC|nr:phytase [Microsporum canis CBS 113480]EEQ29851.1 phytase [Microsporum canis CBS 113480]
MPPMATVLFTTLALSGALVSAVAVPEEANAASFCSSPSRGYSCFPQYSQFWGQYSPYFSLEGRSVVPSTVPAGCRITFAQSLQRHGARYPTKSKSATYSELIERIQNDATAFKDEFAFLEDYTYDLGSDDMTPFGERQLYDSGIKFFQRYRSLAKDAKPFVRAASSERVVLSGRKFVDGFNKAKGTDKGGLTQLDLIISESNRGKNPVAPGGCEAFDNDDTADKVSDQFQSTFIQPIVDRVNKKLPGANIKAGDIKSLMAMCPFDTVARTPDASKLSPFCRLFSHEEFRHYDYLETLGKFYGYGPGNGFGPAPGIGYVNELIARLTNSPVRDQTTVDHELDDNPKTFPLGLPLYADFSHDNSMTVIFTAMGLFNATKPLSPEHITNPADANGYSASWTIPFGARAYFEKMVCDHSPVAKQEYVRVLLNDLVFPLQGCHADMYGRCKLEDFINGLTYATSNGNWDQC